MFYFNFSLIIFHKLTNVYFKNSEVISDQIYYDTIKCILYYYNYSELSVT